MRRLFAVLALLLAPAPAAAAGAEFDAGTVARANEALVFGQRRQVETAAALVVARRNPDALASLILGLRFRPEHQGLYLSTFAALAGERVADWFEAMLWQQRHPEIRPHPGYAEIKLKMWSRVDPRFRRFFPPGAFERMRIRFEEIVWGGVAVDGIPALDFPRMLPAARADYLEDDDLVFGLEIAGDVRAYPLRIMGWHEMLNDVVGGVPVALAYCTLCGAGILFETRLPPRPAPFVFASSGLLYRSNKLMFDRQTSSLWNQFTGEPVAGPLATSGLRLPIRPLAIAAWADWRARHPESTVLSLETGHRRDYGSGVVYRDYFASPDLMFPAAVGDERRLRRKDYVFGLRGLAAARAWPLGAFEGGRVINDRLGEVDIVLVGDAATRTVRAYERGGRRFEAAGEPTHLAGPGGAWTVGEAALLGPAGERLARLPGHVAYWFAWDGYLGVRSTLYPDPPE